MGIAKHFEANSPHILHAIYHNIFLTNYEYINIPVGYD